MSARTWFTVGGEVLCCDGSRGELRRVVLDPVTRTLTHLVVEPRHRPGADRLVPVELVDSAVDEIRLRCTTDEFDALESADVTHFVPGTPGYAGYGEQQLLSWPYFNLGGGVSGIGLGTRSRSRSIVHDRVPIGQVELRRGAQVHATDGPIGRVRGLVTNSGDHQVTHLLLDEGHLGGQRRVAIPIDAVVGFDHGVHLNLTKDEMRELPSVDARQRTKE